MKISNRSSDTLHNALKKLIVIPWIALLVWIDQFTKFLAKTHLKNAEPIHIIPGVFSLHYLENTGAAFGMLKDKLLFFILMTIIVVGILIFIYIRLPEVRKYTPVKYIFVFIIAGAIGNFIDRIIHNYVIDFFYFELIDFPIFNVADCYVSIAAILFVILFLFYYKEEDLNFISFKKKDTQEK